MKTSSNHKLTSKGHNLNLLILERLQKMNAAQVAASLDMSPSRLSYYLKKLKSIDVIRQVSYGVWEVDQTRLFLLEPKQKTLDMFKQVQNKFKNKLGRSDVGVGEGAEVLGTRELGTMEVAGHAYLFVLKLPVLVRWGVEARRRYLISKGIGFKAFRQGESLDSGLVLGWKVWLTSKSVVGYAPKGKRWVADTEAGACGDAFFEFLRVVKVLEVLLGVSLEINGQYYVRSSREHNAHVKNLLPLELKRRGEGLVVWDERGVWLRYDESVGPELETEAGGGVERVLEVRDASVLVREDWNLLKDQGVTRQFLLDQDARIQGMLVEYAENISEHVRVMREIGKLLEEINRGRR